MRAPETEATGTAGASEVAAEFQRLGWGATENVRHDLGTDLFLQVRDERRFDLGLIVGAQVKAGESYFAEPKNSEGGELEGWWFRDPDRRHIDAWLSHSLPHLVVLRDMETGRSYWAHVTADAVVSTGQGAKLLVPCGQTVAADQRNALLDVAKTQRPTVPWEGSIWTAGSALDHQDLLRHALVVPRLVAPHPNAGVTGGLSAEQAVALLLQARFADLERFAQEHDDVPPIEEAGQSKDWRWRFCAALGQRLMTCTLDPLVAVIEEATGPAHRAAATIAAASAYVDAAQPEQALELLKATIDHDDAEPVDHAWLLMQRARASAEVGRLEEARAAALAVVGIRNAAPHDATATALSGAAANLLFTTSAWGEHDLEQVITGADTAASWWRQQTTSRGLDASLNRTFKRWARDTATTIGGSDEAHNQLFVASVLASHLGSQGGWRHLAALTSCETLVRLDRHATTDIFAEALNDLRLAGSTKELALAAKRVAADGPARALTSAVANVDLDRSTRTTASAELTLIKIGGDLADSKTANHLVGQLLATINDTSAFFTRTTASHGVIFELVEALAGVVPASDIEAQTSVRDHVLSLDGIVDQLLATGYGRVLRALPDSAWDSEAAARARDAADAHHQVLSLALLGVAATHHDDARERLIEFAREGSLDAVGALGDVRNVPADVAAALTEQLAGVAKQTIEDARHGKFGIGHDVGHALAVLNAWHLDTARWDDLLALLADDAVALSDKRGALRTLAALSDRVPDEVQAQLIPTALRIADGGMEDPFELFGNPADAAGEATRLLLALGALDANQTADRLLALLSANAAERRYAASVARRAEGPEYVGVLTSLATDADPSVRAAAAAGLAAIIASGDVTPIAQRAVEACLDDTGTHVPAHLAQALRDTGGTTAEALLLRLRAHGSAYVRAVASSKIAA